RSPRTSSSSPSPASSTAHLSAHPSARVPLSRLPRRTQTVLAVCVTLTLALALLVVPGRAAPARAGAPKAAAAPTCGTTDVALNQPTTASSVESGQFPASAATDGNTQ